MATIHRNLTGADLHEPKGADTALSGQVYVSDGAGSGSWVNASTIITNTAFTTGDLKPTHKTSADSGWILWAEGTIGNGSSSSTLRANADTADLFTVYWNGYSNTICPVYTSGGVASTRGVSAAADFAAHKRLALPPGPGHALAVAGAYTGLTTRTLGSEAGSESTTLTASQIPSITSTVSASGAISVSHNAHNIATNNSSTPGGAFGINVVSAVSSASISGTATVTGTATSNNTSGQSHSNMQPTAHINVMIKL